MRRRSVLVSVTVLALVGLFAVGTRFAASAQEEEHREEERSPLTGGWIVVLPEEAPDAAPLLLTFTAEGNMLQTGPRGVSTGVWESTGEETAAFTLVFVAPSEQDPAKFGAKETVRGTLELDPGDDAWHGEY